MRIRFIAFFAALAAALLAPAPSAAQVKPPEGFTALFNGKDLAGWHAMPGFDPRKVWAMNDQERAAFRKKHFDDARKHWTVENGELVNDGKGAYLTTDKEFGDIELLIDYKTVPKADSGIYLRATPQIQIWDYTKEGGKWNIGADKGSGGLWNNSPGAPGKDPLVLADRPFGEWNQFRIVQVGSRTWIWLNDKLVVDGAILENYWTKKDKGDKKDPKHPLFAKGPIQLQTHGGEIRWRNVFVREIPPREAGEWLRKTEGKGFEPIFNGKDLTGWAGAVDSYEVKDGAIVCKPKKGGVLYTREKYGDFEVSLDIRLPPGGNNGLAIRYPGKGDCAYTGMCELQVLDTGYKGKLDARQYHGSAYGMVPAYKGYLRPAGEWNHQRVTVKGSKVRVELNGYVILDADLSQVKEFMGNRPHPGKDIKEGHFGFAGHSDPVEFRNVRIKRLDSPSTEKLSPRGNP